jgi:hypothetical protein
MKWKLRYRSFFFVHDTDFISFTPMLTCIVYAKLLRLKVFLLEDQKGGEEATIN